MPATKLPRPTLASLIAPDRHLVFIRSGWSEHYDRNKDTVRPRGGGAHNIERTGAECDNFRPYGRVYYVYGGSNKVHPVNFRRLGAPGDDTSADRVMVVQVARHPGGGQVVVGWFRGATAFTKFRYDPQGRPYAFLAPIATAQLLQPGQRIIPVPKGKDGMGQSHVCYSNNPDGALRPWVLDVLVDIRCLESGNNRSAHEIDVDNTDSYEEGTATRVLVNRYERDPAARRRCLAAHGNGCNICELSMGNIYPGIGDDYIQVHHLVPLSQLGHSYRLDPVRHMIPVCPNCHAMLHRRRPDPYTPDELRAILLRGRRRANAVRLLQ